MLAGYGCGHGEGFWIGEATNPGPPKSSRWKAENEERLFGSGPEPTESLEILILVILN